MEIQGVEGLSVGEVSDMVRRGGRFVIFTYTISILVMTFKRPTSVHFVRPEDSAFVKGLPFTLISLFLGWWGFPWGLIYTPMSIIENLSGGKDVTTEVMAVLGNGAALPAAAIPPGPQG